MDADSLAPLLRFDVNEDATTTKKILESKHAPWGAYYFPMYRGGAAWRWQTRGYPKKPIGHVDYLKMTDEQVNRLSATEKYDIWQGDFQFQTTMSEIKNRGPLRTVPPAHWEGFCNGVRCAGVIQPEPTVPVTVTAPDGRKIRFEPADIKILLGVSYFYVEKYAQLGSPTRYTRKEDPPNAAIFDLALRYYLEKNKSFLVDPHLGAEIWNQSVVGYERKISKTLPLAEDEKRSYPQANSKMRVRLKLHVLGSIDIDATNGRTTDKVSNLEATQNVNTDYFLYMDSKNQVINGKWNETNKIKGIDFAWFANGDGMDSKYEKVGGNKFLSFSKVLMLSHLSTERSLELSRQNEGKTNSCSRFFEN